MKKILVCLMAMFAICVSFSSCSNSDDEIKEITDSSEIIGTWELVSQYPEIDADDNGVIVVFKKNGIAVSTSLGASTEAKWSIKDDKLYMTYEDEGETYTDIVRLISIDKSLMKLEENYDGTLVVLTFRRID